MASRRRSRSSPARTPSPRRSPRARRSSPSSPTRPPPRRPPARPRRRGRSTSTPSDAAKAREDHRVQAQAGHRPPRADRGRHRGLRWPRHRRRLLQGRGLRRLPRRRRRRAPCRRRRRLVPAHLAGRPDRQAGVAAALRRVRHLRCHPAPRRHADVARRSSPSTRTRRPRSSSSSTSASWATSSPSCRRPPTRSRPPRASRPADPGYEGPPTGGRGPSRRMARGRHTREMSGLWTRPIRRPPRCRMSGNQHAGGPHAGPWMSTVATSCAQPGERTRQ